LGDGGRKLYHRARKKEAVKGWGGNVGGKKKEDGKEGRRR